MDNIPVVVLKKKKKRKINDTAVSFLHILFNICFYHAIVPSARGKYTIKPIPTSLSIDRRDPLSYRGISLAPAVYKVYCSVLNITKSYLYNFDPLKPHFYIVKLGFTGVCIIFLISVQKDRLWVLVRTASPRRF